MNRKIIKYILDFDFRKKRKETIKMLDEIHIKAHKDKSPWSEIKIGINNLTVSLDDTIRFNCWNLADVKHVLETEIGKVLASEIATGVTFFDLQSGKFNWQEIDRVTDRMINHSQRQLATGKLKVIRSISRIFDLGY